MSDHSLLAGWRNRWNRNLLRFLGRRVRAPVDIEDLAQETYLRLRRAPDLREVENPQAYLLRVAGNVVAEWRHSQPQASQLEPVEEASLVDECVPEFELDAHACARRVSDALDAMSPAMRAVVLLRLRDEEAYKEIARRLEMSERQVKRYLARGYDCLRQSLEGLK